MRVILMSGARRYADLIEDWGIWTDSHRMKPDLILVEHDMTEEIALSGDAKRVSFQADETKDTTVLLFMGIPVFCWCALRDQDPLSFDCPTSDSDQSDLDPERERQEQFAREQEEASRPKSTPKKAAKKKR